MVVPICAALAEQHHEEPTSAREALVWVVSWMSPAGGIYDSELRWGHNNYAYRRYREGERVNHPTGLEWLTMPPPEYASEAFYRIQREGALRDMKLMKEGGFDVAVYDMQPEASFQFAEPLSPQNRPLKNFPIFQEWLGAAEDVGLKVGIGLSVVKPPPNVEGMVERLEAVFGAVADHPALWKVAGRPVLMGFGTSVTGWRAFAPDPQASDPDGGWMNIVLRLRETGRDPYFIAHATPNDLNPHVWRAFADAVWIFGPAASLSYQIEMHSHLSKSVNNALPVVWSVSPGYYSGRMDAWTSPDFERIHSAYMAAIEANADKICMLTWNDFLEDTDIVPSANKGRSLLDIFAYYNAWFKSGLQPPIDSERIVVAYPKCIPETIRSRSGGDQYRPTVYYWALLKNSRVLVFGNESVTLPPGLSFGNLGEAAPGSVNLRVEDRPFEAPAIESAKEEGREVAGIFEGYGLHYRYLEILEKL